MDTVLLFFLAAFSSLFTIVSPISCASVFLTVTEGDSKKKRFKMARKAAITSAIVLILFGFAGSWILGFFDITISAFNIAGGILIAKIGLDMVKLKRHRQTDDEKKESIKKEDVSIIPIAIPLLSGPGAMTTTIMLMGQASAWQYKVAVIVAIILVSLLSYLILSRAAIIGKFMGKTGVNIVERILGLIVLVIGVQFVINGMGIVMQGWGLI